MKPAAQVKPPQTRNSVRHGARESPVFLPMPYIRRQPMTCAMPFMDTQSLWKRYCQLRVMYLVKPKSVLTQFSWHALSSDTRSK